MIIEKKIAINLADQGEDRLTRRSMVRLGVRVIHKITPETRAQPIIEPTPPTLSKSLRLRLSPKALKLASKFSTSVDENQHRALNGQRSGSGGLDAMSRIDNEKHSTKPDIRQSTFFTSKVISIYIPWQPTQSNFLSGNSIFLSAPLFSMGFYTVTLVNYFYDSNLFITVIRLFLLLNETRYRFCGIKHTLENELNSNRPDPSWIMHF